MIPTYAVKYTGVRNIGLNRAIMQIDTLGGDVRNVIFPIS